MKISSLRVYELLWSNRLFVGEEEERLPDGVIAYGALLYPPGIKARSNSIDVSFELTPEEKDAFGVLLGQIEARLLAIDEGG